MAASEILICVLGTSRGQGHVFESDKGVGKSCLCYRFIHPGFDDFIAEHPSILALHEYQSPAVNNTHFLYWGRSKQTLPGRLGKRDNTVTIHVVENTVLYQDVTSKPFASGGSNKADNIDFYTKKALGRLESPGKISYWTRDGISLPDLYKPQRYPSKEASSWKRGFLVVVDVSAGGCEFDAQLQRVKKVCLALKKSKSTYMLVVTKMEIAKQESLEKLHQMRKTAKLSADLICTSAECNYNISPAFRIISEKVLKDFHSQEDIPTFEQAAGTDLSFKTSAKRSFRNFTTKWVHSSTERIEDIELTEQYRACKSAVGKFETDRIFAFKLLEKKNREMMVGVNDDPERRREFLEDFIEDHPDLALYRREMTTKIEEYVSEVCELTSDNPPKSPRLVHHYPANDNSGSSNTSSTAASPALKKSPSKNLIPSSSSFTMETTTFSAGTAEATNSSTDTQSSGSFENDYTPIDYVNLNEFVDGSVAQSTTIPPSSDLPSNSPLPPSDTPVNDEIIYIPPEDVLPTDSLDVSSDADAETNPRPGSGMRRCKASTHEWVTLPHSPPSQSNMDIENDGKMEDNRNGQLDDAVNRDDDILPPLNILVQDPIDDVQSKDGTSETAEFHLQDDEISSPQSPPDLPKEDLCTPPSLLSPSLSENTINELPAKSKPPPPPCKPKSPNMHRTTTVKVYPENSSTVTNKDLNGTEEIGSDEYIVPKADKYTLEHHMENDLSPGEEPPPAVPKRTKDYHIVVLNKDSKSTVMEPSSEASNKKEQVSPAHAAEKEKTVKKTKGYEFNPLKKKRSPSPATSDTATKKVPTNDQTSPTKSKKKQGKKLKYSKSDCKAPKENKPLFKKRAPSQVPACPKPRTSSTLPRATFLNMRTRPLPEMPYTLPPDDYDDEDNDDAKEYTLVDTMLPHHSIHSPWPRSHAQYHDYHSQQLPRSQLQYRSGSSDYVNDDEYPRPQPTSHSLNVGSTLSPTDSHFSLSSIDDRPPLPTPNMISSSPQSHSITRQHSHSAQPHPTSISRSSFEKMHLPLSRVSSNPSDPNTLPSPEYSYPKIQGLVFMRPMLHTSLHMSRSTDFEVDEQYVEMKPRKVQQTYQNVETVKSTRSHSMEDLHLYTNFPVTKPPTVFDKTLPLPPRGAQPTTSPPHESSQGRTMGFPQSRSPHITSTTQSTATKVIPLPPRNLLRQTNSLEKEFNEANQGLESLNLTSRPSSFIHHSPQAQSIAQSLQPSLSPRPVPKPRRAALNSPDLTSQSTQQTSTQEQPSTPSFFKNLLPCELPHLEYTPKFSKPVCAPNVKQSPTQQHAVGTSTWTASEDLDYYNVISKSFLSPPKPTTLPSSYLDILPSTVNDEQND